MHRAPYRPNRIHLYAGDRSRCGKPVPAVSERTQDIAAVTCKTCLMSVAAARR